VVANGSSILSQQLLLSVAEQIKLPLLQIARSAEAGRLGGQADLNLIETTAESALRLVDSYALGVRLSFEHELLEREPVSVSSVLYDAGQQLDSLAKSYGVKLELSIAGRYGPVMANRQALESALVSLGAALIEALPALESPQLTLRLATHRCRYGIVAGLYTDTEQLTAEALRQGRKLYGLARQPLAGLTHTAGAGVFVADTILRAMQLQLQVSRHHRLYGLGAVLQPSHQLELV
jgi:hypothetical protein